MTLRALVIGAGWAGEGHTVALRVAGVEVVAMVGRTPEPAQVMAAKLEIPDVRFNWREALNEFKPDIVAIATPAAPHCEIAVAAAGYGCHILCDKPLAVNAAEAYEMLMAVEKAGVKHAYATTSRYAPQFIYARRLLADGLIGNVYDVEWMQHFAVSPFVPYHWIHQLDQGGGALNQTFTHLLGQILFVTGAEVQAATGVAHFPLTRAPIGSDIHDFRELQRQLVDPEKATEWGTIDADLGFTVMLKLQMPDGNNADALLRTLYLSGSPEPNYILFHGESGVLRVAGSAFWPNQIQHFTQSDETWRDMPIPQDVIASLPQVEDPVQRDWNQLCLEFVADIRGQGYSGYPTFQDGWVASEIIDHVRSGSAWTALPQHPK